MTPPAATTTAAGERGLCGLLAEAAARYGGRPALIAPGQSGGQAGAQTINYAQLLERAEELSRALIAVGVQPGEPVGLAMHKSIDSIVAVYGILGAGACYVPIDPFAPADRGALVVANCELRVLVTSKERLSSLVAPLASNPESAPHLRHALLPENPGAVVDTGDIELAAWPELAAGAPAEVARERARRGGDALAYILHTSGSTGRPKGVAISHASSLAFVDVVTAFFAVGPEDRLCSQAPLHFDLSVFDLYVAAEAGAAVVLIPEFYAAFPKKMAQAIDDCQITVWNSVVSALTLMADRGGLEERSLASLRAVIFSGELMPARFLRILRARMQCAELYNVYGQTEANSTMFYRIGEIPEDNGWRIPIGRPFPAYSVFALDDAGAVIERAGQEGELYVRAGTVASGYYRDAERSAERFVVDPTAPDSGVIVYRTGDRVRLDDNGDYVFVGRADNLIKSRGYRIELGDIDLALLSCADVDRAAAVAIPDDVIGNRIVAFVSPVEGAQLDAATVLTHCKGRLPTYMVPETVHVRDQLPQTSTGKVDRRKLTELLVEQKRPEEEGR